MSGAKNLERDEGTERSEPARIACGSPLHEIHGFDQFKLSKRYPRNAVLFVEGQPARGVYVLCEGRAKVSVSSAEGKTVILRVAQPGDLLGVGAALMGRPYGATVETLEHCRIDFVSREDLLKMLDRDQKACLGVVKALSSKLSRVMEHVRLLWLSQSAAEKLARLLVRWCDELGKRTPQGIRLNPGLTQEEIAQMICASRETVTRLLGEFKRKGIVRLAGSAIFIRNRKALESVGHC